MQYADAMSKLPDYATMILTRATRSQICRTEFRMRNGDMRRFGWPTLDVFGGTTANEHQAAKFYSEFRMPGTSGVNAFVQLWEWCMWYACLGSQTWCDRGHGP